MMYTAKDAKIDADRINNYNDQLKIIEQKIRQASKFGDYEWLFAPVVSKQTEKVLKQLGYKLKTNKKENHTLISWE